MRLSCVRALSQPRSPSWKTAPLGPSLGSDSIAQGIRSAVLGSILVVVFMLVYYRFSGLIATVALALNFVITYGGTGASRSGRNVDSSWYCHGIILTLGMAVDANVLIFERVREELRTGKSPRAAVDAGFDRAFSAILDANVTTIVAAVVLFQFGAGPVQRLCRDADDSVLRSVCLRLFL
mgnify:CR=1 FL=1